MIEALADYKVNLILYSVRKAHVYIQKCDIVFL